MHYYDPRHPEQHCQGQHPNDRSYHGTPFHQGSPHMYHQQQMHRQITIEDAIEIARKQVPGQVVKVELDREGGILLYEVDILTPQGVKYEVEIDISTGNVLKVKLD